MKLSTEENQLIEMYLALPFNALLGLQFHSRTDLSLSLTFDNQTQFIGNTHKSILHGGVIASVIDAAGGALALLNGLNRMQHLSHEEKQKRLFRYSTIDLRVDFLEPGHGQWFLINASTLREGARLSVIRIELYNEKESFIAAGSATYQIGRC